MKIIETEIPEVKIIEPRVFADRRGSFFESYNQDRYRSVGIDTQFVQDNVSNSVRGVLRGMHFQNPHAQGKLVTAIQGEIYDVAVDLRVNAPTFSRWVGVNLNDENRRQLWVPAGFAHGFLVLSEKAIVSYKCDGTYQPNAERSLLWNDPDVGIRWPTEQPILSDKDAAALSLKDLEDHLFR
jgi:dTDP-4-dehydrorhamnose 3,5-epimerase